MNIEKWIIAHFSPTGGTKKVAEAIAAGRPDAQDEARCLPSCSR